MRKGVKLAFALFYSFSSTNWDLWSTTCAPPVLLTIDLYSKFYHLKKINSFFGLAITLLMVILITSSSMSAQRPDGAPAGAFPGANGQRPGGQNMKIGRFYGKIVDEKGVAVPYATVSLFSMQFDTTTRTMVNTLVDGQITDDRGEFSLENLPIIGEFDMVISFIGYAEMTKKVTFGLKRPERPAAGSPAPAPFEIPEGTNLEIDLGKIVLSEASQLLDEVVVTDKKSNVVIALDKKIYRVDQDITAIGGTAEDALKNVPSLSVDFEGNLNLRNGSPQVFIDGRPTTLSLNQIPSDAIETVEVITNPSSKYDASGGQSGIVNIVLKKNKKLGYNGTVSTGVDSQTGYNLGLNSNLQEGKFNIFLNGNLNSRRGDNFNETYRTNLFDSPNTITSQIGTGSRNGTFTNIRGGLDWFYNDRNTITFQGSFVRGSFENPGDLIVRTDTMGLGFTEYNRTTLSDRVFRNAGASILYKHLYAKKGKEFTADIHYNGSMSDNNGYYENAYTTSALNTKQLQTGSGANDSYTFQTDYINPLTPSVKLEAGARMVIRTVDNNNFNFIFDNSLNDYVRRPTLTDNYLFNDNVSAAYFNLSKEGKKWGAQVGLRAESSVYKGQLADGQSFSNQFPLSLFPTVFLTRKVNEEDNVQLSVSRRVNRPNFFQLLPFTDFSDSINLQRGNPDLVPEFTSSVELSYQNIINNNNNVLFTLYYKRATNLITGYQITEVDPATQMTNIISTYANSNKSTAYGLELTMRNKIGKRTDLSTNLNFYNSEVDASNVVEGLKNNQFTWFIKENLSFSLPKDFGVQISGEYRSRTAFNTGGGGGRFGGGGGGNWGGGGGSSAQGYTKPVWFADISLRKSFLKSKALTVSLNVQDVFRSRIMGSYSESPFFVQNSSRNGNFQVVRLNVSYRFGKSDFSLFKKKNTKESDGGMDMMGG